jgi:hypothetical protein
MGFCLYKQKQKELKIQKKKKKFFENLKDQEDSQWCYCWNYALEAIIKMLLL